MDFNMWLTVVGAPLGDERVEHLEPGLVASAQDVVAVLLADTAIPATDVRVQFGRTYLL